MNNKRFRIFRIFTARAEKAYFSVKMPPKKPILKILNPLLFYIIQTIILHLCMKFGESRYKNKDFMAIKPHFSEFFAVCGKSAF